MIVYHGSYLEIPKPDLIHSRANVDFGCGFYVTPLYEQAEKWSAKFKRRGKNGVISRYRFDESQKTTLKRTKRIMIWSLAALPTTRYSTPWNCFLTA